MDEIKWGTPPAHLLAGRKPPTGRYLEYAAALAAHAGHWAESPAGMGGDREDAKRAVQNIRRGRLGFAKGYFEALVDTDGSMWVRCLPREDWPKISDDDVHPYPEPNAEAPLEHEEPGELREEDGDAPARSNEIRAWGREHGWKVGDRGRMPSDLREAYDAAMEAEREAAERRAEMRQV